MKSLAMMCSIMVVSIAVPVLAQETTQPVQDQLTVTPDFAGDAWVDAKQPIGIRLSRPLDLSTERLAVVIGRTDLSALFTVTPLTARYAANTLPLPRGESEMTVYLVKPGQPWQEIAKIPLRVRLRGGFEKAEVKPGLTFTTTGQVAPGENDQGVKPVYPGVTFNPALRTTLVRRGATLELQSNFLAVTKQTQALRFGAQGQSAPKFDLSDYVMRGVSGPVSASIGHVSFGSSKHLLNSVASRGVTAALSIAKLAELSVAAMNGSSIVGWDNPVGFTTNDHRVFGAGFKVDAIRSKPGAMLFDVTLLHAARLPQAGFNQGEVNDKEKSRGAAFHFAGKALKDRISVDGGYSVSRFENPADPTLEDGLSVVEVRPVTKAARFADMTLALIKDAKLGKNILANFSATLRHERVEPLFRTLGASVQANIMQNIVELSGGVGPLAVQASHARAEDNLDDLESVLKTFTHVTSANVVLPTAALFSASKPSQLLPQLTYGLSRTHQFANDLPINGDFTETHAPDQVSASHSVDAQWTIAKWRAGYRWNISDQDNRQVGREKSDLGNLAHNVALAFSPVTWLDLSSSFAFEGSENKEFDQKNNTRRVGAGFDIRPMRDLALNTTFSRTWIHDDPRTAESASDEVSAELSQNVKLWRRALERPSARVFLRYQRQSQGQTPFADGVAGQKTSTRNWALNSGVSINAF